MINYEKINNLIHLADRAKANDNYTLAEKLMKQLFIEALKSKDTALITHVAEALFEHRRLHIAQVLKILKRIDPIQSQRKELS